MDATGRQTRDRYDRQVRRARLSIHAGESEHRLAFTIEEALRLVSLPGENEGRSYYFRYLRVAGLPHDGVQSVWVDRIQWTLRNEAMRAVHGADPRAQSAPAVFFHGEQEALEILLHRLLARRAVHEWFWPMVTADGDASAWTIPEILEALQAREASWVAVAMALFAEPAFDVVRLLEAIPTAVAEGWLRAIDRPRPSRAAAVVAAIPRTARLAVQRALRVFGVEGARTVWLATLAVLLDSPADLALGTAVSRARVALQQLASEAPGVPDAVRMVPPGLPALSSPVELLPTPSNALVEHDAEVVAPRQAPPMPLRTPQSAHEAEPTVTPEASSPKWSEMARIPPLVAPVQPAALAMPAPALSRPVPDEIPDLPPAAPAPSAPIADPATLPWYPAGLPTAGGGLFFLLNALQRIGISQALDEGLAPAVPDLVPRVLRKLASHATFAADDPIALWVDSLISDAPGDVPLECDESWWPTNLRPPSPTATIDLLVRVWALGVRLWCWRAARIVVNEIVSRRAVFSVNRTDLDVSLPLEEVDVRVRRVGLDLDPGWLPWFGRVVRFHYLYRGELYG